MKGALKSGLKYTGYLAFFVVATIFFVHQTLPLDAAEDYLVRKAADEHNSDLVIERLDTWGLTGFEAAGVTLTPHPTAEQVQALQEAEVRRKAWFAARKAAKQAGTDTTEAPKAIAKKDDAPAPKKDEKAGDAKDADPANTKQPKQLAAKKKTLDDKPPPLPAGPQPLHISTLRARVAPLSLLRGIIEGDLEAEMLGGRLATHFKQTKEQVNLGGYWETLDLASLNMLKAVVPLPVTGVFEGEFEVQIPRSDKGDLRLANLAGHLEWKIGGAAMGPGRIDGGVKMKGMLFDVPRARMGDQITRVTFERGKAKLKRFDFKGPDVEGELTGEIRLANKFERWGPRLNVRFKFSDAFLKAHRDIKMALNQKVLRRGTALDGSIGFATKGNLKTLTWKPKKPNTYKRKKPRKTRTKKKRAKSKKATTKRTPKTERPTAGRASSRKKGRAAARARSAERAAARNARAEEADEDEDNEDEDEDEVVDSEEKDDEGAEKDEKDEESTEGDEKDDEEKDDEEKE